jgi:hypothetical protein
MAKDVGLPDNERTSSKTSAVGPCKRQEVNCVSMLDNNAVSLYIQEDLRSREW